MIQPLVSTVTVFDRVYHDIFVDRLRKRIAERAVIRQIRAYLDAGALIQWRGREKPLRGDARRPAVAVAGECVAGRGGPGA